MDSLGIEPRTRQCECRVIPLYYEPEACILIIAYIKNIQIGKLNCSIAVLSNRHLVLFHKTAKIADVMNVSMKAAMNKRGIKTRIKNFKALASSS